MSVYVIVNPHAGWREDFLFSEKEVNTNWQFQENAKKS